MALAIPIQFDENPAVAAAFAVVATVIVAVAVEEPLKSALYGLTGSVVVTRQLAFGAVVAQENAVRPVPCVCVTVTDAEFPLVAPALTDIAAGCESCGTTDEGTYCRT
jgi:hypothetical protein